MLVKTDPIGFDPVRWVERLLDVNESSQFEPLAKNHIKHRLLDLKHELEKSYGRLEG